MAVYLRTFHGYEQMTGFNPARINVHTRDFYFGITDNLYRMDVLEDFV